MNKKHNTKLTNKQLDKKLEKFLARLEQPNIKAVFTRLKDR